VRTDVEAPSGEIPYLILPFADDQADDRLLHPRRLLAQAFTFLDEPGLCQLIIGGGELGLCEGDGRPYLRQLGLPAWQDALVHAGTGDFIDAHQHGFAGLPARCTVVDKVVSDLVQTVGRGDHLVILAEELFQQGGLIRV
jgi:hypothetical protein